MSNTYLIELGTEELPPKSLLNLSNAFSKFVVDALANAKLDFESTESFATPRRLAIVIKGLTPKTPEQENTIFGPPKKVAFDADGKPTKAAEAFCQRNGISPDQIQISDDKAEKIFCLKTTGGDASETLLPTIVNDAIAALPIAKRMRWGASRIEFVRPVHWLVMLCDERIIEAEVLGLKSGRTTRGHRFHSEGNIELVHAKDYETTLENSGNVIANYARRAKIIREQVEQEALTLNGKAVIDEDLLDEVTSLVEWPVALAGKFDEAFLSVPAEALISSMKEHQKYFHVVDKNETLIPAFITVSNIRPQDPKVVISGNERVIRPRLSDAAFFFETDKKTSLVALRERLKTVVFQAKLGSTFDKTERVKKLAETIASRLDFDSSKAGRAAELSKSDLVSAMVNEFSDMQGIAGQHYALNDGEDNEVAVAITEQYLPKFAGDSLPSTHAGICLAIADRLDTIVGIFGIGQSPSGSKDPFALRRASVAVLRILVDKNLNLDLRNLIDDAYSAYEGKLEAKNTVDNVLNYMLERMKAWYEEANIETEVFLSVAAKKLSHPLDIDRRVKAVAQFFHTQEAPALAAANKRVANILSKLDQVPTGEFNLSLCEQDVEKDLAAQLDTMAQAIEPLIAACKYDEALRKLSSLQLTVDAFFDGVMVMAEDEALRTNRCILLQQLRSLFYEIADISCLAISNK